MKKDTLKSLRGYVLKAVSTFVVAGAVVIGGLFVFVGCGNTPTPNPNPTPTPTPDPTPTPTPTPDPTPTPTPDPTPTPTPDTSITYQQFIANYPELAREYAESMVDELSYADDVMSTSYAFVAGEDRINQVLLANVVKTGETERELKIATIDLAGGVDVQDIVDGTDTALIVIESENALTFDAKEEFFKQNSTIRTQIANIITQELGDDAVELAPYVQEEFEPEIQIPATVAELVAQYPDKVNEILNKKCFTLAAETSYTLGFDKSKMQWAKWYVDGTNEITSIQFLMDYNRIPQSGTIASSTLTLNQPISIENFLNENFHITAAARDYYRGYDPTIQGTYAPLTNAIFEIYGKPKECPDGVIRLIKDNGSVLPDGLGECRSFTIVEISDNQIYQNAIHIKYSSDIDAYTKKLSYSDNYSADAQPTIYYLQGEIIEYTPTSPT